MLAGKGYLGNRKFKTKYGGVAALRMRFASVFAGFEFSGCGRWEQELYAAAGL
jgi:hypothetical protein